MTEIKIGDWVTNEEGFIFVIKQEHMQYAYDFKLWQPKEGEWCWQLFSDGEFNLHQWSKNSNNQLKYEPFIGELPSFIKEKQDD